MLWDRPRSNSLQRVMDFSSTSSTYTGINMHNNNLRHRRRTTIPVAPKPVTGCRNTALSTTTVTPEYQHGLMITGSPRLKR